MENGVSSTHALRQFGQKFLQMQIDDFRLSTLQVEDPHFEEDYTCLYRLDTPDWASWTSAHMERMALARAMHEAALGLEDDAVVDDAVEESVRQAEGMTEALDKAVEEFTRQARGKEEALIKAYKADLLANSVEGAPG